MRKTFHTRSETNKARHRAKVAKKEEERQKEILRMYDQDPEASYRLYEQVTYFTDGSGRIRMK